MPKQSSTDNDQSYRAIIDRIRLTESKAFLGTLIDALEADSFTTTRQNADALRELVQCRISELEDRIGDPDHLPPGSHHESRSMRFGALHPLTLFYRRQIRKATKDIEIHPMDRGVIATISIDGYSKPSTLIIEMEGFHAPLIFSTHAGLLAFGSKKPAWGTKQFIALDRLARTFLKAFSIVSVNGDNEGKEEKRNG